MDYEIVISNTASEELLKIIHKYWIIDNEKFKYNLKEIMFEDTPSKTLISKILSYSYCIFKAKPCALCASYSNIIIHDRKQLLEVTVSNNLICDKCKSFSPNYKKDALISNDLYYNLALLSEEEHNVLKGIINLKTKFLIYRHIFNNNIEDETIWKIINQLQKLGLVWIERESSWKIKSFNFDRKLIDILR